MESTKQVSPNPISGSSMPYWSGTASLNRNSQIPVLFGKPILTRFFCTFLILLCIFPLNSLGQRVELVKDFNTYGSAYYSLVVHNGWLYWLNTGEDSTKVMAWDQVNEPMVIGVQSDPIVWTTWQWSPSDYFIPYRQGVLFFNDVGRNADLDQPDLHPFSFFDPMTRQVMLLPSIPRADSRAGYLEAPLKVIGDDIYFEGVTPILWKYTYGDNEWSQLDLPDLTEVENAALDSERAFFSNGLGLVDGTYRLPLLHSGFAYAHEGLGFFLRTKGTQSGPNGEWAKGLYQIPPEGSPVTLLADGAGQWRIMGSSDTGKVYVVKHGITDAYPDELWITDGTVSGTKRLLELHGLIGFNRFPMQTRWMELMDKNFQSNGDWVAMAMELGEHDWELFVSDGTEENTRIVDLVPGPSASYPQDFIFFGNQLFFRGARGANVDRIWGLWRFDLLTGEAEVIHEDIFFGRHDADDTSFAKSGSGFYFDMWAPDTGEAIHYFNVEDHSLQPVIDSEVANWGSEPRNLTVMGDYLYFSASKWWLPYTELYRYSAVTDEFEMVSDDLWDVSNLAFPGLLGDRWGIVLENDFFELEPGKFIFTAFSALSDESGNPYRLQLYASDGTPEGTYPLTLGWIHNGEWFDGVMKRLFRKGDAEYIYIADPVYRDASRRLLLKLSGWPVRIEIVDIVDLNNIHDGQLTAFKYVAAGNNIISLDISYTQRRFAVYAINTEGADDTLLTELIIPESKQVVFYEYNSNAEYSGCHYFLIGDKVILTDGTTAGTKTLDLLGENPDKLIADAHLSPVVIGNYLYFFTSYFDEIEVGGDPRASLWELNLETGQSRMLLDRDVVGPFSVGKYSRFRDGFVFATQTLVNRINYQQLWFQKPGLQTPRLIGEFDHHGPEWNEVHSFKEVDDMLYFSVGQKEVHPEVYYDDFDLELWVTDGHVGQYKRIADIYPGEGGSNPAHLCEYDGTLYFSAIDPRFGRELMKVDQPPAPWLGIRDDFPDTNLIRHRQHGLIHLFTAESEQAWVHDTEQGWFWTNRSLYGSTNAGCYLYSMKQGNWIYYIRDGIHQNSWIFNYQKGTWQEISGF